MKTPFTPYQKSSETSCRAAMEKDASGSTKAQCAHLLEFLQDRGMSGVCIFEAADYLSSVMNTNVVPGTASGRLNDLMNPEKCRHYFGADGALVQKSDIRRINPHSGKTGTAYVLKVRPAPAPAPAPMDEYRRTIRDAKRQKGLAILQRNINDAQMDLFRATQDS